MGRAKENRNAKTGAMYDHIVHNWPSIMQPIRINCNKKSSNRRGEKILTPDAFKRNLDIHLANIL